MVFLIVVTPDGSPPGSIPARTRVAHRMLRSKVSGRVGVWAAKVNMPVQESVGFTDSDGFGGLFGPIQREIRIARREVQLAVTEG